jgi:RNA polymerase subunit RPABC4/transcription elongation factor Spt4
MSIQVQCPNGHTLKVKEEFAGRAGLCPHCHARVQVPKAKKISDEDIVDLLGPPTPCDDSAVHQEAREEGSGVSLVGSSIMRRRTKICTNCRAEILERYDICPHCHMYFTDRLEINRRLTSACAKCGLDIDRHAKVCPSCGALVSI